MKRVHVGTAMQRLLLSAAVTISGSAVLTVGHAQAGQPVKTTAPVAAPATGQNPVDVALARDTTCTGSGQPEDGHNLVDGDDTSYVPMALDLTCVVDFGKVYEIDAVRQFTGTFAAQTPNIGDEQCPHQGIQHAQIDLSANDVDWSRSPPTPAPM